MAQRKPATTKNSGNGANLGFEQKLWQAADMWPRNLGKLVDNAMEAIVGNANFAWVQKAIRANLKGLEFEVEVAFCDLKNGPQ